MLYLNCRELPIHNFNEVIVTDEYSHLIKDGAEHLESELIDHWQKILDEYHTISNDQTFKKILRDKCEIIYLQNKAIACEIILQFRNINLSESQSEKMEQLQKSYNIRNVKATLAATKNKLSLKIEAFKRGQTHEESKSSLGYNIAQISNVLGYKIDRFKTTVEEWINCIKLADEIIKSRNKK